MNFLGRPGKDEAEELFELPQLTEDQQEQAHNDTKLKTNEFEIKLQTKILNTYYFCIFRRNRPPNSGPNLPPSNGSQMLRISHL